MDDEAISVWAKPSVAAELGRRLEAVADALNTHIMRQQFPTLFASVLQQALHQPNKLLASGTSEGLPISVSDLHLWPLSVLLVHAATSDTGFPEAPISSWQEIIPIAAAAEFFGLALDLIDDIQDGDAAFVEQLGIPMTLNAALAFLGLTHAAIDAAHLSKLRRGSLHTLFTSAMLAATGGQYLDLSYGYHEQVTIDESLDMTSKKSGPLIGLLFQAGAFVGFSRKLGAKHALAASGEFFQLGRFVGIIAQLENDLQDGLPSESGGKKSDQLRNKKTLPLVFRTEVIANGGLAPDAAMEATLRFVRYTTDMYRIQALDTLDNLVAKYNLRASSLRWLITEREAL